MVKIQHRPGMVVHDCNPSIQKSEAGGSRVLGQPRLHKEILSPIIIIIIIIMIIKKRKSSHCMP
jgi:hypothetical protein